jgi:hypothetical protein
VLGTTKWGSGPSVAFLHEDAGPWVVGMVANNIWSLGGGSGGNNRTNQMLLNPIIGFHPADGWALSSSPEITANWIANGNKWTVPVGGGVSKVARLGEQPIKLELGAYYNAIAPAASLTAARAPTSRVVAVAPTLSGFLDSHAVDPLLARALISVSGSPSQSRRRARR